MSRASSNYVALGVLFGQVCLVVASEHLLAAHRDKFGHGPRPGKWDNLEPLISCIFCVAAEVIVLLTVGVGALVARRRDLAWLVAGSGVVTLACLIAGAIYWRESRGLW